MLGVLCTNAPFSYFLLCAEGHSFFLRLLALFILFPTKNATYEKLRIGLDYHKSNFLQIFKCRIIKLVPACHIFQIPLGYNDYHTLPSTSQKNAISILEVALTFLLLNMVPAVPITKITGPIRSTASIRFPIRGIEYSK